MVRSATATASEAASAATATTAVEAGSMPTTGAVLWCRAFGVLRGYFCRIGGIGAHGIGRLGLLVVAVVLSGSSVSA
jgi:hypothetical protein